ncbi:glycosyltransferase 87 family protein [Arthrobacter sp. 35W]|uniref:glycosyltransferase 87 family protein n=1 Tax=Arthrobacter sp. 35W TaxID=1132441 RepID=UPI00047C24D6|nr:glycosyltransferase 87 family protein [Arthrobacter sp. 35W]
MQDSHRQAPVKRARIVVPSRSDSLLSKVTEAVGGPLGRRTAPGIVDPGFFTVERVLVAMVVASAFVALLFKFHCREAGWTTPDQYSTTCWSGIPNSFVEHNLSVFFPFFSPGAGFDSPPLAGIIAGITAWLTAPAGTGALRQLAFFDLNAALLTVAWLATVVALARSMRRRPWDAAIVAASPLLLFAAFTGWDLWAGALVAVGLLLFARKRTFAAGAVLGLAAGFAPYALLVVVAMVLLSLRAGRLVRGLETVAAAAAAWLLPVLTILVSNAPAWTAYVSGGVNAQPSSSSLYGAWNLVASQLGLPRLEVPAANTLQAVLLAICVLLVAWLALGAARRPRVGQLAFLLVAAYTLTDKHAAPEQAVWLLPLLALAHPKWRAVLLWQVAAVLHFLALMLFLGRELGGVNAQHAIDMPYFVLAALLYGLATIAVVGLVVRDVLDPGFDVVRRAGADDPQGGVLEFADDVVLLPPAARRAVPPAPDDDAESSAVHG